MVQIKDLKAILYILYLIFDGIVKALASSYRSRGTAEEDPVAIFKVSWEAGWH